MPKSWNSQCNAPFKPDPDIAGPGVITSFIVTAWLTCLIAVLDVHCGVARKCQILLSKPHIPHTSPRTLNQRILATWAKCTERLPRTFRSAHPRLKRFTKPTLEALCDLQIITGTAMTLAGLGQLDSATLYHQNIVLSYCFLTLNSFWAARFGVLNTLDDDGEVVDDERNWHFWTRTVAVMIALIMSLGYQIIIVPRTAKRWDSEMQGMCFLYHDNASYGQNFLWIAGTAVAILYLAILLGLGVAEMMNGGVNYKKKFEEWKMKKEAELRRWYWGSTRDLLYGVRPADNGVAATSLPEISSEGTPQSSQLVQFLLEGVLNYIVPVIYWLWLLFLALWAWGDSESVVLVVIYIGFAAWNTFDILDLKISNSGLLLDSETTWGFGQILAMGLLALILLQVLDISKESRRSDENTRTETELNEEAETERDTDMKTPGPRVNSSP